MLNQIHHFFKDSDWKMKETKVKGLLKNGDFMWNKLYKIAMYQSLKRVYMKPDW